MLDPHNYIQSGILEEFVMGLTSDDENREVMAMAARYPEIQREIDEISASLEQLAVQQAPEPDPTIKPLLMATIDYIERIKGGEIPSNPPELYAGSTPADFSEWLERSDMALPADFMDVHARLIAYTPQAMTAIVWLQHGAPAEVHEAQYEKFLVLEGSCDIRIGERVVSLSVGDYLSIPLHETHAVTVTSANPCKVILQRLAA